MGLGYFQQKSGIKKQEAKVGWLFIAPALIGFSIFTYGSIIRSCYYSLTEWDLLTKPKFIGLKNYMTIFSDHYFYQYMKNTLFFVVTLVPIVMVISLFLALLINVKSKSKGVGNIYRTALLDRKSVV